MYLEYLQSVSSSCLCYVSLLTNLDMREASMCDSKKKECELGNCCVQSLQRDTYKFKQKHGKY